MSSKIKKTKYQKCGVGYDFNRMIEMSRKILILKTFVPKMIFFNPSLKKTDVEHLQK
jgi:hypothetical protein